MSSPLHDASESPYEQLEDPGEAESDKGHVPATGELPIQRGEYSGCCAPLYRDVQWALLEGHVIIMLYCYPRSFSEVPLGEQVGYACVGSNPIYWAMLIGATPCLLAGRWVHALTGQGGPVRHDELEVEHEARVQWIYFTDGPFACAAIFTLVELALILYEEPGMLGWNPQTLGLVLDFSIDAAYIAGNMLFLEAMRHRNVAQIRCAIVANGAFAVGLLLLLVLSISRVGWDTDWHWEQRATFAIRFIVVFFFIAATAIYSRLWSCHGDIDDAAPGRERCFDSHTLGLLGICVSATLVWAMLGCVVVYGDPNYIWNAIAGA